MKVDPNKPKTAFLFYASTLDALEELPKEQQGKVALTLLDFAFRDDVTAPFDCPDDEWMVLSQIFEGIVMEKKRYQIGMRLNYIIISLERMVPRDEKKKASLAKGIEALKRLRELARKNPDEVREVDIYCILGSPLYRAFSLPLMFNPSILTEFRSYIAKAPQGQREKLEKELNDLLDYCNQLYPVPPNGTQQPGSTPIQTVSADSTPAHPASSSPSPGEEICPYPYRSKGYVNWMETHSKQRQSQARTEPKADGLLKSEIAVHGEEPPSPKPPAQQAKPQKPVFQPNDFDEAVLNSATHFELFDVEGFR